jgi:hypothetical protein
MKRALPALLLVFLTLCCFSCKKKTPEGDGQGAGCSRFEPGEVIVGFKNTVTMEEAFDYANNLHLPITQMFGFLFASPWPTDSIPSMDTLLNTKPYIKSNGFSASVWLNVVTHVLTVSNPYWNMDAASQQDWLKTKKTLGFTPILGDSNQSGSYIMVKVPVGKERRWVEDLKGSPLVSWTELNCYMQINGNP